MKRKIFIIGRIITVIILFLFSINLVSAQEEKVITEPLKEQIQLEQNGNINVDNQQIGQQEVVSGETVSEGGQKSETEKSKVKTTTTAKQVKSSRPDLTKSNGARPPTIVRPSGSGIPKGAGKPGGAVAPGRR